ncbi:MAG: photosynthetic complex putative assembly protein PuhB [Gammaproteobacteria bacterium]|jgi:hypothetical protein|nr:photosynthetic complex putative assembly protein PuhB [Gammaproteobacteria bacterium]
MPVEELHELEPIHGLPDALPDGEEILWQGSPDWWSLARRAFHLGLISSYFVGLAVWQLVAEPAGIVPEWAVFLVPLGLGAAAIGMLALLAWLISTTTVYTITNRRVVMRFGVALPLNLNLPFAKIAAVSYKSFRGGYGDLALDLDGDDRVAYLLLWPYARPWHVRKPQPMLRSLPDSARVADILANALASAATGSVAAPTPAQDLRPAAASG